MSIFFGYRFAFHKSSVRLPFGKVFSFMPEWVVILGMLLD